MTGLHVHISTDATALAAELACRLGAPRPDPFVMEVVVTPHAHLRRWLTNELAHRLGRPGEGVCAGVTFLTPGRLLRQLGDEGQFWHPGRLAWRLLQVIGASAHEPRLEQLRRHLAASRNAYPVAYRIASLFQRYLLWRPALVRGWEAGDNRDELGADLGFDAWQPVLWRLAAEAASPLAATDALVARLRNAPAELALPPSVSFVQPDPLSPWWLTVLDGLAEHRDVHVSLRERPSVAPGDAAGPAARLTAFARDAEQRLFERATAQPVNPGPAVAGTLGWLQRTLHGESVSPPPADGSVQVHGGHGLERQVEILRDAITDLLAADPSLEPRHIVVGCPNLTAAAPLIQAAFRLPSGVPGRHVANDFRVQLADRSSAEVNPLVSVLVQVLTLIDSRASATEVLDLCAKPPVGQRFDLDADSVERLTRLAAEAGVRWGLSPAHRERYGLGRLPQNTWSAGLQRMLLGVALSEEQLPMVGTVLPLDGVGDGDLVALGGLSELISRLSRFAAEADEPASLAGWVGRLQWAVDAFTLVGGDQAWQRTDALWRLAALAEQGDGDEPLTLSDIITLVRDEFERGEARSTFGNGSLTVCSLRSLRGVPYRVVCLLGVDDGVFPRLPERDGDNLMLHAPRPGEPDPPAEDRQALADAVQAARQSLLIVHQARSTQTNEAVPPPAALADLLELLGRAGVTQRQHPLQPFSPTLFGAGGPPTSYDRAGLRGATALSRPRQPSAPDTPIPPAPPLTELALTDLIALIKNPVQHFLRERCGLSYWSDEQALGEIPIELDGLQRWAVGDRLLALARAGHSLDQAVRAEWLRGAVPPGAMGTRLLEGLAAQVTPILEALPAAAAEPVVHHDIALDLGDVRLTARVATQQDLVLQASFGRVSPIRRVSLWLQLLALAASTEQHWHGLIVGRGDRVALRGPDRATATALLGQWVRLYRIGLNAPLPLPLRFGMRLADLVGADRDPFDELRELGFLYQDDASTQWRQFYGDVGDLLAVGVGEDDLDQPGQSVLAVAAAKVIWHPLNAHQAVPSR